MAPVPSRRDKMTDHCSRRRFAKAAAAAGAIMISALLSPVGSRLASADSGVLEAVSLTDAVTLIDGAGTNVVVLETTDGLVLVDSGAPEHAETLLRFIDEHFTGASVRVLFNTHWHEANTGANEHIGESGARIIAHENTRLWMTTEYYVEWEKTNYLPRPPASWPTATFHSSDPQPLVLEHGGHRIEYGHLGEAHTDGDIYVHFIDENVLAVGDVLGVDAYPVPDYSTGGWIGGLQESTNLLLDISTPSTRVVAAQGPARTRDALEAQIEMLTTLRERIRVRMIAGKSVEEILAENVDEGYEPLGDPSQFVRNVYNGLWWGGRLRGAY